MAVGELFRGSPSSTQYTYSTTDYNLYDVQTLSTSSSGEVLRNNGDGRIHGLNGGISTVTANVSIEMWDLASALDGAGALAVGTAITDLTAVFDGRSPAASGKTATLTVADATVSGFDTGGGTTEARSATINLEAFSSDGSADPFDWAFA